jgi:hypothetical protein
MRRSLKFIPWLLPLLGIVLGYGYAYVFFHGLLETWQFVGKPEEDIARIIGIRDGRKLLIATETGKIYSFEFYYQGQVRLAPQLSWEKEQLDTVDPASRFEYYGADFISLPPPFQVEQLYDLQYVYRVEGKGEVKFALASDGNLWMWNHQIAGLTGLVFDFYPVIGFLVGLAIALFIAGVNWLKRKDRFSRSAPPEGLIVTQPDRIL